MTPNMETRTMASSMGREVGTCRTPRWNPEAIGGETVDRAAAIRRALHDARVKRTVRQRTTHLTMWERAVNPTAPVPMLDRPFQMTRELKDAGATMADALAYPRALCAYVTRLYRSALRALRVLFCEVERADAQYRAWLVDAMADGVLTPGEARAGAECLHYRIAVSEELAAKLLADAEQDGGRDPRPAA